MNIADTLGKRPGLPSIISAFINSFNKVSHPNTFSRTFIILNLSIYQQAEDKNEKDLMLFIMQAKPDAWRRNDEDLKKVIEIYEYL